jgi:hypothetical protein
MAASLFRDNRAIGQNRGAADAEIMVGTMVSNIAEMK